MGRKGHGATPVLLESGHACNKAVRHLQAYIVAYILVVMRIIAQRKLQSAESWSQEADRVLDMIRYMLIFR